jgi:Protein of unknown function (DUF3040)
MQGDSEPTTLSEGERRILASIEAELDLRDPGFAAGYRRRLEAGGRRLALFAVAAILGGSVLMVATFTTSLVLAAAGAPLMGIGGAAVAPRVETAARRMIGFLGWWVDPNGADRTPGLRDDAR